MQNKWDVHSMEKNTIKLKTSEEYGDNNNFCNDFLLFNVFLWWSTMWMWENANDCYAQDRLTVKLPVYRSLGL